MRKFTLRWLLLLSVITSFAFQANAQIQIGNGTSEQGLPINPNYDYNYSQSIYLSSEINASGDITELSFQFNGDSDIPDSKQWTVYIGQTIKDQFATTSDWIPVSGLTEVFNGEISVAGSGSDEWITIDITDFTYDGTSNLVIGVIETSPDYNSSSNDFYSTSVSNSRSLVKNVDGTLIDANSPPSGNKKNYISNIILGGIVQTCPASSDLAATSITASTADLGWTIGYAETAWNLKVSTTEIDPATEAADAFDGATSANPHSLSGLNADDDYYYYVQANCGTDDLSEWVGPFAFSTLISCPAPTGLVVADITQSSALLKWVSGGASNYNLFYGPADFVMTEGTEVLLEDTFLLASDLISGTNYEFYVQDSCADGDASVWVGPFAFTTECGTFTAPHAENFDEVSTPNLPNCWNSLVVTTSDYTKVVTSTSQSSSESNSVYLYNSSDTDVDLLLISPEYSDLTSQLNRIRFKAYMNDSGLEIGTMTDPTDVSTFTVFQTIPQNDGVFTEYTVNFDATYTGTDSYIVFRHLNENTYDNIYIDDYSYEAIPSCFKPSAVAVSNITENSANFTWTTGGASNWNIEYGEENFVQGTGTFVEVTNAFYTILDLTAQTTYQFYVQDSCGAGDESYWSEPLTFSTACDAFTELPFTETFNSESPNEECWTVLNENGDTDSWDLDYTSNEFEGDGVAMMYTDYNSGNNDDYLVTPQITLTGNQRLIFNYRAQSSSEPNDFEILISTTTKEAASFTEVLLANASYNNTSYIEQIMDLSAYSGDVYIAFRVAPGGLDGYRLFIDNVIVEDIPACYIPTALAVSDITFEVATLSWTQGNTEMAWNVEYGLDGFILGEGTTVAVTDTFALLEDLVTVTDYSFYVQADCESSQSLWEGPFNFTTDITCPAPTALTLYDYTATTATFTWVTGNASNWNIEYGDEDFVLGTGTFVEIEDTFYTIEGLTPETTYEFYVQDSCGSGDESLWTGPISVTTTSTCPQPIELMASPLGVSATLSWNGLFATNWDIEWGEAGFTNVGTPTIDNNSENSVIITELTEGTEHEFYVRADCGSDNTDVSEWTGPYSFTTLIQGQDCALATEYGNINDPAIDAYIDLGVYNWYTVVLDQKYADVIISTCGTVADTDTRLWIYDACEGTQLGYNDDECDVASSITLAELQAGTYYVRLDEFSQNEEGDYTLEITGSLPSTENDILTFEFTEQTGESIIDAVAHTVNIIVPFGTEVSDMTPAYTLSIGATTDQETTDFSSDVLYNIVAQDEVTSQEWTVIVSITPPSTNNDFLTFSFPEETTTETVINSIDHTIAIEVGNGTLPGALVASYSISQFATINVAGVAQVSGTTPNAFVYGTAFEYTVVAENGDEQIWNVTVTEADIFTEALFFAYSIEHQASPAVIDTDAKTINVDINPCVDLGSLIATYELSYNATASINEVSQVSGTTANDFSSPVIYNITAEDATTTEIWTITVNQLSPIVSDYPYLEDFEGDFLPICWTKELPGGSTPNDITHSSTENHTEGGTSSTRFSSFSWDNASEYNQYLITETFMIDPMYSEVSFWHRKSNSNAEQLYFGIATTTDTTWTTINLVEDEWNQAFTDLSMYNGQEIFFIFHYNAAGSYWYVYMDDLTIKQSENTDITVYDVPGQLGTTDIVSESDSIHVMMPFGTAWPVTYAAEFELISSNAEVLSTEQVSTVTENTWVDNLTPVVYTVTAQDGTTREWSVYVDVALNPAKEILTYSIEGEDVDTPAEIDAANAEIHVTMPIGTTDFTDLLATFTLSDDATVAIVGTDQASGVNLNTWTTAPLVYTVTAQDGTTKDWSVYVAAELNFENEILAFEIDGQESATPIDPANPIIDIVMPAETPNLSGLTATFTLSDAATATVGTNPQVSGTTINNWSTGTVVYNVAAENGTVKEWTINVSIAPFTGTEIVNYTINGQEGPTEYMPENDSIHIYMLPTVTSISDRAADFILSEGATVQVDGIDQVSGTTENDFSNSGNIPVIYTVTAGDGTERNWKVVVDLTVGVNEIFESKDLNVYPNPNNGQFELAINIANLKTVSLEVINTQGQIVSIINDVNINVAQSIDLSELATGVYYIKVITEKETLIKKVNIIK